MKILLLCNKPPYPAIDGGSLATYGLAGAFIQLQHEVSILTMTTPKHKLAVNVQTVCIEFASYQSVYVDTSVNFMKLLLNFCFSQKPYNAKRFISGNFRDELIRTLKAGHFDIIQLEGVYLTPYTTVIREFTNAPVVLRAHNAEFEIWQHLACSETNLLKRFYFKSLSNRIRKFESAAANDYDLLVPITEHDLNQYMQLGNTRPAMVCPAGFNTGTRYISETTKNNNAETKDNPSLFFLGSLDWKPNQEGILWLISAVFRKMYAGNHSVVLHIAGRNAPHHLKKKLKQPGIVYHGEIPDAAGFIGSHDILVAPCFSGSGMRVKVLEAMAYGKCVITTPLGAAGMPVSHGENIMLAEMASDFIRCIDLLLNNNELRRKIGNNAKELVKSRFDNIMIASQLIDFYKNHLR
jgi:glycosyltransferase involved in cell wall biosynthesis